VKRKSTNLDKLFMPRNVLSGRTDLKIIMLLINMLSWPGTMFAQNSSNHIPISETYSSNGMFKLKSISYDENFPTLLGESKVVVNDGSDTGKLCYKINRAFDLYEGFHYFLALSNDGKKALYIRGDSYASKDEDKAVTVYENGQLIKGYSEREFTGCDEKKEKCGLFYEDRVFDWTKLSSTIRVYRDGTNDKDRFLSKNSIFNKNDTIYLIDSRKKVAIYDLNSTRIIANNLDFDSIYNQIKNIEVIGSRISYYEYKYRYINDFENRLNTEKASKEIGKLLNLRFVPLGDSTFHKYHLHRLDVKGLLDREGTFHVEKLSCDSSLNKEKIEAYFKNTKFRTDFFPREADKQYVSYFLGGYRDFDQRIVELESAREKERRINEFQRRLSLQTIDGVYIPKNMLECMTQLDSILNFESKKQLKEATDIWMFNSHMGGLGMWIRNNWGLHGGSRLLKYFNGRGIGKQRGVSDQISYTIVSSYVAWLKGDKNTPHTWETKNPVGQR